MPYTQAKKHSLDSAMQMLLNSGIQSKGGGFYAWYDLDDKSYSHLYSEITGYGITALLFLYSILKDEALIKKARRAADWLIRFSLHPSGGVRTRLYKDDDKADKAYSFSAENLFSFDTGMVLYGLVNLYRMTLEERFLQSSHMLAGFLLDNMQNENGSLSPVFNAKTGTIVRPHDNKWSNQPGPFHAKVAMGLMDLFEVTKGENYKRAGVKLCEYALSTQEPSGRFITDKTSGLTHLHPHCYAAEGLFYTGFFLGIPDFIKSAKKATEWAFEHVSSRGINELWDPSRGGFNRTQRCDILAQVLRLGLINSIDHKIEDLVSVLLTYQYSGEETSQRGGFLFGEGKNHVNSWCTMFAIQALAFYKDRNLILNGTRMNLFI